MSVMTCKQSTIFCVWYAILALITISKSNFYPKYITYEIMTLITALGYLYIINNQKNIKK